MKPKDYKKATTKETINYLDSRTSVERKKDSKIKAIISTTMKNPKDYNEAMKYASCVDTQTHLKKCKKCRDRAYLLFPSKEDLGDKIKNVLNSN